ncbi:hypothetical protein [Nocardia sp. NPDC047648]|uniref:hypothetical protein n=1 Tax=Nocardia sp. NPDC047648 TaxID=3155625 RepID=UPI0033CD0487
MRDPFGAPGPKKATPIVAAPQIRKLMTSAHVPTPEFGPADPEAPMYTAFSGAG